MKIHIRVVLHVTAQGLLKYQNQFEPSTWRPGPQKVSRPRASKRAPASIISVTLPT